MEELYLFKKGTKYSGISGERQYHRNGLHCDINNYSQSVSLHRVHQGKEIQITVVFLFARCTCIFSSCKLSVSHADS